MRKISDLNEMLMAIIGEGERHGLLHTVLDDVPIDGRLVQIDGRKLTNFASCSYMGLELDPRLKAGAIEATNRFGTQLSASRLFMSAAPYRELEAMLGELGGSPALVTPTTSLGHLSALPVLMGEEDVAIYDQRLHHSVQIVTRLLPGQGVRVEMLRHNRMDILEERIRELRQRSRQIWYLADGIYSIYGNRAPLEELSDLLDRYEQFHVYFDDAHGTSWLGKHGRGHVLSHFAGHPRVVTALSLNKAFAAAGGCLFFPTEAMREKIRTCGGAMNFSGPIQPPMLGAALASARLHLSDELPGMQDELAALMQHADARLKKSFLPYVSPGDSPILYIGMGLPRAAHLMGERLLEEGFFVTAATFPGVPVTRSGMRVTLTRHLKKSDIDDLVSAMEHHVFEVLDEVGGSLDAVYRAFDLAPSAEAARQHSGTLEVRVPAAISPLRLEHRRSVRELDAEEWDRLHGAHGSFSVAGLAFIEELFNAQQPPENDWKFHYFIVRDQVGAPVLATFFSEALWKDDMLSRKEVSTEIEALRQRDPYYLTSRTLAMGSLLTEGAHLWLDRDGPWREALAMVLKAVGAERERSGAATLVLRDFPEDSELEAFFLERGFFKFQMPESCVIAGVGQDDERHLASLTLRARRLYRKQVLCWDDAYEVEVIAPGGRPLAPAEQVHLYQLYENVKLRNVGLNTFALPRELFGAMAGRAPWELLLLKLKPEVGGPSDGRPVAVSGNFAGRGCYVPLVLGLDYNYVHSHALYRIMLWNAIRRARSHEASTVLFGFGATLEKNRVGARSIPQFAYIQTSNHDNLDQLMQHMENTHARV